MKEFPKTVELVRVDPEKIEYIDHVVEENGIQPTANSYIALEIKNFQVMWGAN